MNRLYKLLWCCGCTSALCLIIGIPLLSVGAANIPYSLTRDEIAQAGVNQGAFLEQKQRSSEAWRQMTVGAGFSFTGVGIGFLLLCYCTGWLNRLGIGPDPDEPPRIHVAPPPPPNEENPV
jgi:hypothetical protein